MIKNFSGVQIGDTCTDYGDQKFEVYDKGSLIDLMNKYRNRLSMGINDYLSFGMTVNDPCVIVKTDPSFDGDCILYRYGTDGAYVEEPEVLLIPVKDEYDNYHPNDHI